MTHQPLHPVRGRARGSFHALRLARRLSHRTGKSPLGKRSRQGEVRRRRTRVLVILALALGLEVAAAALTSPLLGINRITLRSAKPLPASEEALTRRAVALPAGSNLLRAPLGEMERHLKALPWVRTASVRWLSPHSLRARFTPRDAVVIANLAGQDCEVDETGTPIRIARAETESALPHIEVEKSIDARFGVPLHDEAVLAAMSICRDAPRQPMVHIAKIKVDHGGNICLNMVDGIQVQLGQPEDLAAKMRYIQRIYELDPNVCGRMIAINLSVPKQPACTLKSDVPIISAPPPGRAVESGDSGHGGDMAL